MNILIPRKLGGTQIEVKSKCSQINETETLVPIGYKNPKYPIKFGFEVCMQK